MRRQPSSGCAETRPGHRAAPEKCDRGGNNESLTIRHRTPGQPRPGRASLWQRLSPPRRYGRSDIPFIALNPGASFRGLHDSIVNHLGNENPQHAASACTRSTPSRSPMAGPRSPAGRWPPRCTANVGLLHATMAIFNAWCDRVPLLLLGRHRPGRRGQAAALDRLDPHRRGPGRDDPPLHEMGRPAGLARAAPRRWPRAVWLAATAPWVPSTSTSTPAMQEAR